MKLSEKGRHAPAPKLRPLAQRVVHELCTWTGLEGRTHWLLGDETVVDGADFHVGQDEVGHIHLESEAHVMLPARVVTALVRASLGAPFQWSRGVVVHRIAREADVEHAVWLFQLSYDHLAGVSAAALIERVERRAAVGVAGARSPEIPAARSTG